MAYEKFIQVHKETYGTTLRPIELKKRRDTINSLLRWGMIEFLKPRKIEIQGSWVDEILFKQKHDTVYSSKKRWRDWRSVPP
jgi:hypothetical protein